MTFDAEQINALLETEVDGSLVGLRQLQLRDEPIYARQDDLVRLMNEGLGYDSLRAALLLVAWNCPEAISKAKDFISVAGVPGEFLSPGRLRNEDDALDDLAYAFLLGLEVGLDRSEALDFFKRVLAHAVERVSLTNLKNVLIEVEAKELVPDVRDALSALLSAEQFYKASLMLPVLAKLDPHFSSDGFDVFLRIGDAVPNPLCCVAEAAAYMSDESSLQLLTELQSHKDFAVREEARISIGKR